MENVSAVSVIVDALAGLRDAMLLIGAAGIGVGIGVVLVIKGWRLIANLIGGGLERASGYTSNRDYSSNDPWATK